MVAGIVLLISLVYFFLGTPSFYEEYLGSFTAGGTYGFLAPSLYQFGVTFILFFFIPLLIITQLWGEKLSRYGWQSGNRKAGWIWVAIGIPVVAVIAYLSADRSDFQDQYPLFISQLKSFPLRGQNITVFILYEFTYIFYYVGWEFFFRGFALFGLREKRGIVVAILFQTVLSTLLHIHKPMPELIAAFPGGIIFGLMALNCRSIWPVIAVHWSLGFALDLFILLR